MNTCVLFRLSKMLSPNWLTAILFFVVLFLIYRYLTRFHDYWECRGVQYEKPYFLAGSLWEVFSGQQQIGKHFGHLYSKYKSPYFGIFIFGKPYLIIRDPEIIKNVTIRDFHNFKDRTFACDKGADDMTANSLFILRNPDWKNIRNKLTPIFTSGKIKMMFPLMKKSQGDMIHYLEKRSGTTLDIKDVSGRLMTDLVATCIFGFETNSFDENGCIFRDNSKRLFDMTLYKAFCLFSYFFVPPFVSMFKLKLLDTTFLRAVFMDALKKRENAKFRRNDFVDLLLGLRDSFHDNNFGTTFDTDAMVAQSITFYVAGFETTSNAIAFALYELCLRPDCQNKLRREIQEHLPEEKDITFENVQQLKYLDMVLSETLRRYPFGPFLNRNCKEDYVIQETGLKIDKGTPILIAIDGIHNDPNYYKDPEIFDPERFGEGVKQRMLNNGTYMPFGIGPRNCIGDRFGLICAKVSLVYFLRKFKVERCKDTPVPLVLEPKSPFVTPIKGLPVMVWKV